MLPAGWIPASFPVLRARRSRRPHRLHGQHGSRERVSMIGPILLALAPVALLVAFGHGLRRTGFIGDTFWPQAERLCYVLLPALFADSLANARLQSLPVLPLAATLVGSTALAAALLLLVRRFVRVDGAGFTSVFQGAVRFNNYVGTALAAGLFGAKASRSRPYASRRSSRPST